MRRWFHCAPDWETPDRAFAAEVIPAVHEAAAKV